MDGPRNESIAVLHEGRYLRLKRRGRWEYVERVHAAGAAHIVAVTPARELVLVEQPRAAVGGRTIELPAGIVGDEAHLRGESVEDCAIRELEEETGYRAKTARVLAAGPSAPGLTSEMLYLVWCENLERAGAGGGVGGEEITVHRVPLADAPAWLEARARAGLLVDARIYAGLYFAQRGGR